MKSRTLVISDIHGCHRSFNKLLEVTSYHPSNDRLILLGDFVDRGPSSCEVVEQIIGLVRDDGAIAILGNHDDRFADVMLDGSEAEKEKFFKFGGRQTLESYVKKPTIGKSDEELLTELKEVVHSQFPHHIRFIQQLPYYLEDEDFIYVHAGLNPRYPNWKAQPKWDFIHIKKPFYLEDTVVDKTVVFGHTKTIDLHGKPDVWFGKGKIGIDGACAFGMQLNALEITNKNEIKTYTVQAE